MLQATRALPEPFFVIATENPIETAGTYPLPEAQCDRFFMVLSMGYPSRKEEVEILSRFFSSDPFDKIKAVCGVEDIARMKREAEEVYVHPVLLDYMASISEATRGERGQGVSPRGTLALMRGAKAWALISGRSFVIPDDVKYLAPHILSHRLGCDREEGRRKLLSILSSLPVPTEDWGRR